MSEGGGVEKKKDKESFSSSCFHVCTKKKKN
jgi:hypothetical protein